MSDPVVLYQHAPSRRGTGNSEFRRGTEHWKQGAFRCAVLTGSGQWQSTDSPWNDVAGISGTPPVWVTDTGRGGAAAGDSRFFQGPPTAVRFVDDNAGGTSVCHVTLQIQVQG